MTLRNNSTDSTDTVTTDQKTENIPGLMKKSKLIIFYSVILYM